MASSRSAASGAPAWCLPCAAASARCARRAGSGVSSAARSWKAAAAARPPRACARPAERSSSAATSSSSPAVAWARCQARRSGSTLGVGRLGQRAMDALALLRRGGAVDRRAHERMPEAHLGAELDQARRGRRRRRVAGDPELLRPRATPAPDRRRARRPRPAAAAASPAAARQPPPEALLDPAGQRPARRPARTRPPARRASARAAAPAAPAGCRASRRRSGRAPARRADP